MNHHLILGLSLALIAAPAVPASAAKPPDTWEGLYRVKSKRADLVYLLPGADFRGYTKVIIDTPQVAFKKDWKRDYNSTQRDMGRRVDDKDVRRAIDGGSRRFAEILTKEYGKAGYQVVTEPGPDVLRISTAVINIEVNAPDIMAAGRSRTYSQEAGQATLVLEARDSVSESLLGRAVDARIVGDGAPFARTSVSNAGDFERLFSDWARAGAAGLTALKEQPPFGTTAAR
jgi:uncharacterized protein DUF3313